MAAQPYFYQTCRHHDRLQSVFEHQTRKPVTGQTLKHGFPTLGEAGGYRPIHTASKETSHQQREMAALHRL